jgi:hypothetical protein
MRIGRAIIIPAVLALGAAGSILASSAATATAAQVPAAHSQSVHLIVQPYLYYHA